MKDYKVQHYRLLSQITSSRARSRDRIWEEISTQLPEVVAAPSSQRAICHNSNDMRTPHGSRVDCERVKGTYPPGAAQIHTAAVPMRHRITAPQFFWIEAKLMTIVVSTNKQIAIVCKQWHVLSHYCWCSFCMCLSVSLRACQNPVQLCISCKTIRIMEHTDVADCVMSALILKLQSRTAMEEVETRMQRPLSFLSR